MTIDEQIKILQAAKDGKEIEVFSTIYNQWETKNTVIDWEFDFIGTKYRIKPEPKKEIKLHQYLVFNKTSGHYISTTGFFPSIKACKGHVSVWAGNWQVQYKLPHTEITVTKE